MAYNGAFFPSLSWSAKPLGNHCVFPEYPPVKILVCITGVNRGYDAIKNIFDMIVLPTKADVAMYVDHETHAHFRKLYPDKIKYQVDEPVVINYLNDSSKNNQKSNTFRMFYRIWRLHQEYAKSNYDLYMRLRTDAYITKPLTVHDIDEALQGKLVLQVPASYEVLRFFHMAMYSDVFWLCRKEHDVILSKIYEYLNSECIAPELFLTNYVRYMPKTTSKLHVGIRQDTIEHLNKKALKKVTDKELHLFGCDGFYNVVTNEYQSLFAE